MIEYPKSMIKKLRHSLENHHREEIEYIIFKNNVSVENRIKDLQKLVEVYKLNCFNDPSQYEINLIKIKS